MKVSLHHYAEGADQPDSSIVAKNDDAYATGNGHVFFVVEERDGTRTFIEIELSTPLRDKLHESLDRLLNQMEESDALWTLQLQEDRMIDVNGKETHECRRGSIELVQMADGTWDIEDEFIIRLD